MWHKHEQFVYFNFWYALLQLSYCVELTNKNSKVSLLHISWKTKSGKPITKDYNLVVRTIKWVWELFLEMYSTDSSNEKGELFTHFCFFIDPEIDGNIFPHNKIRCLDKKNNKTKQKSLIYYITIAQKRRRLIDFGYGSRHYHCNIV